MSLIVKQNIIGDGGASDPKMDDIATEGLDGTSNSLAYRVEEIEKHFHSVERWYGSDGDGTGSTSNNLTEFQITAGTGDAFGTEVQILGANDIAASDFPVTPVKFDLHRVFITNASANNANFIFQIWSGTTTFGAATLRTESPFRTATGNGDIAPVDLQMGRIAVAEKVWARVKCETNGATLDFLAGVHAYRG